MKIKAVRTRLKRRKLLPIWFCRFVPCKILPTDQDWREVRWLWWRWKEISDSHLLNILKLLKRSDLPLAKKFQREVSRRVNQQAG